MFSARVRRRIDIGWRVVLTLMCLGAIALVQNQRAIALRDSCQGQNARHDRTIKRLDDVIKETKNPEDRARSIRNRDATVSLIEALQPRQDCEKLIRERVGWPWGSQ
jgi:hypothetical protein